MPWPSMAGAVTPVTPPAWPQPGAEFPRIERVSTAYRALIAVERAAKLLDNAGLPLEAMALRGCITLVLRPAVDDLDDARRVRRRLP